MNGNTQNPAHDIGEAVLSVIAMPADTNPAGNIFGGWILSQIDLAGSVAAKELVPERVVTISMKEVIFKQPVYVGDLVACHAKVTHVGGTSITVDVNVTAERYSKETNSRVCQHVTSATVTYVAVDEKKKKKTIDPELKKAHGF